MGASRTRLRGSGVARAEASRFARAGFLTLIFLVAGIPGSFASSHSYPHDADFCAAFVPKAICEGGGAQVGSDKCDTAYNCDYGDGVATSRCSMSGTEHQTFSNQMTSWFPLVDHESTCHNKDTSDGSCSSTDGCFVVYENAMDTCVPFPKTGVTLLSADGASNVIQAYYHSLRQSEYCASVNDMTNCPYQAGCHVVNGNCQYAPEFGVWEVVTACENALGTSTFTATEKDDIAKATIQMHPIWAALETFVTDNGLDSPSSYSSSSSGSSGSSSSPSESLPKWPDPVEYCATWEVNVYCSQAHLGSDGSPDGAACAADPVCYWNANDQNCEQSLTVPEYPALTYAQVWEYNKIFSELSSSYDSQYTSHYDVATAFAYCDAHVDATACEADTSCGNNYGGGNCDINHALVAEVALADGAPYPMAMRNELYSFIDQVCWKAAADQQACVDAGWRCAWQGMFNPDGCGPNIDAFTVVAANACVDYDPSGTFWSTLVSLPLFANAVPPGVDGSFERTGATRLTAPSSYPGLVGCALACEGWDVDQARCASKPYYCHWSEERHKCVSAVGAEPCPESVPTARWLPVSYASDATRLADAFAESENAIVRVDWKGSPLAYLRVTRDVATFAASLKDRLFVEWLSEFTTTHDALNVDFELYSTYEDALARSKEARWTHCANVTGAPFPGGCAPDANSDYASLRLSDTATDHAVFVESPAPVAFGDAFVPPLDSNQAEFTGWNNVSAAGDLSLGGADAFTIRVRADLVGSDQANLLEIPGLLSVTTVGQDPNNQIRLRFTGLCGISYFSDMSTAAYFSGSTESVVTYDGSHVKLYVDGEEQLMLEMNYGKPCAYPGVPSNADASWSMGGASNSFDDVPVTYLTKGFLSFLTTWTGVALSPQNVKRMSRADYRYVPRPTHHFNFDEGAGTVVRDHFRGVGGADTLRAYFGPTPAYRKMPTAPSLSTFLKATAGDASVAVAKSKSYAHIYEGSFTMQAWFRADGVLGGGSHQVFGNYFSDTSGSSVGAFFNLAAQPGTNSNPGFYGLTLEYTSEDQSTVRESVLDGDALEIDRWYHLAVQRDVEAGEARVFVDGVLKLSSTDGGFALGLDGANVDSVWVTAGGLFLGGHAKDGVVTKASFSDFQVYSAAVPPTFPTGPGVCAPPSAEFLVLWLPLDRAGDQVDASGRGAAAIAPADFVATAVTPPAIDAYTRPPSVPSDAPCGPWGVYDGCAAIEPEACSACLASAGFDTGECGMKAVGGAVTFEGGFTVHTFTRDGTFEVLRDDITSLEVLVVGGGGGGGAVVGEVGGAGGGAGGAVAANVTAVSSGDAFDVVVGAGGAGGAGAAAGESGAQSAFGSLAADGGAGGALVDTTAAVAGGAGAMRPGWTMGSANKNWRAFAGAALVSPASGAPRAYAGGGGACVWDQGVLGCSAGSATGGNAFYECAKWRCDAHQNSGGGGGAAAAGTAGRGADGVVIVRYQ